ncbi:unnamed protein product [Caenorhabditis angaria]|uniref:FiBrilliN homolog n=1 Tax=Caenorhabditis angaria TaxID=860376 RepID=A0A9P1IJ57_9PELO|nr:unnamed protein product [Caenorhabditis angaria]
MRSRAPFSCCPLRLTLILVLGLSFIRETNGLAKNFVNSSHPDLRPTFVVNFDTSTVICQHSADPNDLHIHNMSSLCDGKQDCFANPAMHDEVFPYCEKKCDCSGNGACLYDGSNPQCYCDSGFSGKSCELADKNECLEHPCHLMAQCQNTLGSYECRCLPGYSGDGHQCIDIDECSEKEKSSHRCPENSNCINLPGTFYCNCTQGFTPKGNQGAGLDKCVDINECDTGANNCQQNEICENTIGSFKCVTKCSPGYKLINSTCFDIDECADEKLHRCDSRAECINTIGGYQCECDEGFVGDGKNCQPKASCSKNSAICDRHAYCMPKMELCVCTAGYTGDGITCHDINECEALENACPSGGRCLNLDGGFVCCGGSQSDEKCIQEQGAFCSGGCGLNAVCQNQTCQCVEGFKGDANKKCVDINECEEDEKKCGGVGDRCVNLFGGYVCCQHGSQAPECLTDQSFSSDSSTISSHAADFTTTGELIEGSGSIQTSSGGTIKILRGHIPKDFELASNGKLACTSYCPANSECLNGFCECSKGYGGNALIGCEDVDECITETCNISENEWCVNLIGSFICCNPTNATHDDCLGLEISKDRGLHVIGGNEEDTILATATNTTSDQLVTSEVVQQSRNFSSGQIIFTRGKVRNGQNITFESASGSGSGNGNSGVWTEDEDSDSDSEEDDDLMEKGSGREVIIPDFTASPGGGDGNIRVRITTLGETIETSTKSVFLEAGKNSSTVVFETGSKGSKLSGSSGHFVSGKGSGPGSGDGSLDLTGLKPAGSSESESGSSSGAPGSGTSGDSSSGSSGSSSSGASSSNKSGSSGNTSSGSSGSSSSGSSGSIKSGSTGTSTSGSSGSPGTSSEETSQEIGLEIKWIGNSSQTTEPTPIDEKGLKRTKVPETSTTPEGVIDIEGSGLVFGREETIGGGKKTTVGIITGTPGETTSEPLTNESTTSSGKSESTIGLITGTPEATSVGPTEGSGETTTSEGSGEPSTTSEPLSTTNSGESGATVSQSTPSTEATKAPVTDATAAPSEATESSTATSASASSTSTIASEGSGESNEAPESGSTTALEESSAAPESTTPAGSSSPASSEPTSGTTEGSGESSQAPEASTPISGSTTAVPEKSTTSVGSSTSPSSGTTEGSDEATSTSEASSATSEATVLPDGSGESTQAPGGSTTSESTLSTEGSGVPESTTSPSSKGTTSTLAETSESTLSPEGSGESSTTASPTTSEERTITPEGSGTTSEEINPLPTRGKTPASTLSTKSPSTPEMGLEISGKTTPSLTTNEAEQTTTESNGSGEEMGLEISGRTTPEMGLEISGKTTTPEGKITIDIEESTTPIPSDSTVSLSSTSSPVSSSTPEVETSTSNESSSEGTTKSGSTSSSEATIGTSESTTVPTSVGTSESVKPSERTSAKPSEATVSPVEASTTAPGSVSSEATTPETSSEEKPTSAKPDESSEATGSPAEGSTTASGSKSSESTTPATTSEEKSTSAKPDGSSEATGSPTESSTTISGSKSSESTTLSGSESSTTVASTSSEATTPATSSKGPESSVAPSTEATTQSIATSTPSVTPSSQAATIQGREEVTTPTTKETFALPTTTALPSNETTQSPSENIKCTSSDQCGNDALCERRTGVCRCEPGFEGIPPKTSCIDVDECATGHHKCHESSRCQNYIGGYACFCPTGYRKSENGECIDINECVEHNSTCCGTNAKCVNKPGTYSCECESGYIGDGYKCVPNEKRICEKVEADRANCANNRACMIDRNGIIDCSECISGYELINGECVDINECSKNPCASDANCSNLNGTFQCSCKQGYRGDGFMCSDINECQDNSHSCHPHADCTNLPGSFECKCQGGFEGDGITKCMNTLEKSCEDVEKFCGHSKHVSCLSVRIFNGSLSSICECEPGFRLVGGECVDIDECDENRHNCDPASSICVNTEGSFKCDCAEGYEGEGGVCTDIDECDRGMAGCDGMAMCINRMGSCGCKCMPGYTGDGVQCSKIEPSDNSKCTEEWERLCEIENKQCTVDEEEVPQCGACLIGHQPINGTCQSVAVSGLCKHNNDCSEHADCIDIQPNSHLCVCTPGFIGDGKMCDDIDECSLEGMCDSANSACVNTIGAFKCVCNEGFELDGHVCVPSVKSTTLAPSTESHREPVSLESSTKVTTLSVNVTESSKPGSQSSVSTSVAPKTENVTPKPTSKESSSTAKPTKAVESTGATKSGKSETDLTSTKKTSSTAKPTVTKSPVVESTTLRTATSKKSESTKETSESSKPTTAKPSVTTTSVKLESSTKKVEITTPKSVSSSTQKTVESTKSTPTSGGSTSTKKPTSKIPSTTSQSDLVLNVITTTSTPLTVILSSSTSTSQASSEPTPPPTASTTTRIVPTTARRGPPSMTPPAEETTTASANGGYGEAEVEVSTSSSTTTTVPATTVVTTTVSTTTVPTTVTLPTTTLRTAPAESISCSNCHQLAICSSNQTCVCREGFIGDGIANCSKLTTADCMSLPSLCASNGYCDTKTRDCKCDAGYIGDGYICAPHPQDCVLRPNLCPSEAICQNRRCQCLPGYTGDGIKCVSIHERASNCSQCDENASCVGGTTCKCNPGYFGNGLCCVPDPTDCVHFTGICHTNAQCDTSSRQCKCASGYSGNGLSCFPQKSCRTDRNVCSNNGICLPTGNCICRIGFEGDGYNCEKAGTAALNLRNDPISSCLTPCDSVSEICIGGKCLCKDGFRQNSTNSCIDINECEEKLDRCDRLATCQNTIGNHVCLCPNGYIGDGTTCIPHTQNTGGISVYCEADGMTLVLGDSENFEGRIFVRGQAENPYCSKSFSSLLNSQKPYVFKVLFEHCDVQLQDNHTMASTVVVQKHAMFLTSKADSYDLRCQYPIGSQAVESQVNVSELATTSTLVDNNSELAPTCKLGVSNEQQLSISSATVGDTLKLSLSVIPASANFGILPKNCFAVNIESGERYTLTDSLGCAIDETLFPQWSVVSNNSVQAIFRTFKWPDSSMIRFQCDCSPCIGSCSIPSCMKVQRFRRHIPIVNDEIRENLVLMNGVEGLAVSSIINVHDSSNLLDDDNTFTIPPPISSSYSPSEICVKLAPLIIALCSFIFCSLVLLYLFSPKTTKSEF